jgi:hypothetical protein
MQRVVGRQEALRISFLPGKEQPVQLVRKTCEANFHFQELSPAGARPEAVEERAQEIFRQPFDLLQGPLYRAEVLRRAPDDHVIVLSMHHSIADGWTLGVFVRDLCGAYLQGMMGLHEPLPEVEQSYTAWGAAERAYWKPAEVQQRLDYWRPVLAGATPLFRGAVAQAPLERAVFEIAPELAKATRELARRTGATLFSTLLAIFRMTLARRMGADDVTVGTPVANRGKQNTRETMGYYSGNVPLRGQIDRAQTVSETLQADHERTLQGFANAMPFAELVRGLGDAPTPEHHPIYDVRFALQNHPIPDVSVPQLSARLRMRSTGTPRFELGCEITEAGETLESVWLFRGNRFSADDIRELDRIFQEILAGACREPEGRVSDLLK